MARPQLLDFIAPYPAPDDAPKPRLVTADITVASYPSPAMELQAGLEDALNAPTATSDIHVEKYPFAWTLIGVTIVCGAVWAGIAALILA